jgi:hypothetical protein
MQFLRQWIHAGDLPDTSNSENCRRREPLGNSQKIAGERCAVFAGTFDLA